MKYFPICLDISNKNCIVIGGGRVAERKARGLLVCSGNVTVISPALTAGLTQLQKAGEISWISRCYQQGDISHAFMVIAATDDPKVQEQVFNEAEANNILLNVADVPDKCNFILPATLRRGDLSISVSTSGKSPALAKRIRQDLEAGFGDEYGTLLNILGTIRTYVLSQKRDQQQNERIFSQLVESDMIHWIKRSQWDTLFAYLKEITGEDFELLKNELKSE